MIDLYDMLMAEIEPDLMSDMIDHLPEMYANETEEEAQARAARYAKAFVTFEERFETVTSFWKKGLGKLKQEALIARGEEEEREEESKIQKLSNFFK